MMIGIREGFQEGRCGTKRRYKEKSAAQEENCNTQWSQLNLYCVKQKAMMRDYGAFIVVENAITEVTFNF